MDPIELVAVVMTLVGIILTIREKISCWPVAIVGILAYMVVFIRARLYADTVLQPIYVVQNIYGWWYWAHGGARGQGDAPIVVLNQRNRVAWLAGTVVVSVIVGAALARWTNAAAPYADATLSTTSLVANWLLARKVLENWWLWIAVNIGYVILFWRKHLVLSAGLYAVLLVLAIAGLIEWQRSRKRSMPGSEEIPYLKP
ncbi:MAG: nicotinamide riboside transporter PnuC [Gemmatimonadaceae bacterium]